MKVKKFVYNLIQLILIAIIIYCLYNIGTYYYQNYKNTQKISEVNNIVDEIEDETINKLNDNVKASGNETLTKEELDALSKNVIARLKKENQDVVSYIKVDEVKINNPVTFTEFDNDYYLYRDLDENTSTPGTLFMNGWNNSDFSDMNTTIFGHNLRVNDKRYAPMFKLLLNYEKEEFVNAKNEHFIEVYTEQGYKKYKIFTAYYTTSYEDYILPNRPVEEWVDYLYDLEEKSIQDFGIDHEFKETDQILTLSTCDENRNDDFGRFVVHAIEWE